MNYYRTTPGAYRSASQCSCQNAQQAAAAAHANAYQNQTSRNNNSRSSNCGERDSMPKALAMAYVLWQPYGNLYEPSVALQQGTIFQDLDKPFCGRRC